MSSFTHILFPVDFSARCEGAAPFVDCMARRNRAKVTLFSAANPYYPTVMEAPLVDPQDLLVELKSTLDATFTDLFQGLEVNRVAVLGEAAEEITEYVRAHNVDLVMMPSHGYGPFRRLLLGSVTSKILHDLACPVWTTAHTGTEPDRQHLGLKKILCAVDGTPASAEVMRFAAGFAKESGADLRLVTVVPGIEAWPERQMDVEFEEQLRAIAHAKQKHRYALQQAANLDVPSSLPWDVAAGGRLCRGGSGTSHCRPWQNRRCW